MALIDTGLMAKLPEELLGGSGSSRQVLEHGHRIPLELWTCRKNVLVVKAPLVLTKHLHGQLLPGGDLWISLSQTPLAGVSEEKTLKTLRISHQFLLDPCQFWIWELLERRGNAHTWGRYSSSWLCFDKRRKNYAPAWGNDGDPEFRITVMNK